MLKLLYSLNLLFFIGFTYFIYLYLEKNTKIKNKVDSSVLKMNFASEKLGASILKYSKFLKSTSSILKSDLEQYMIYPCEKKNLYFIISLSEDVYIEEIIFLDNQPFSSKIKKIQIYYSINLIDIDKFIYLGEYKLKENETKINFKNKILLRYLKFEIIDNHFDKTYFCTLTNIKVYGKTLIGQNSDKNIVRYDNFNYDINDHYNFNIKENNTNKNLLNITLNSIIIRYKFLYK